MLRCPSCAEGNPERARFCLGCGTSLTSSPPAGGGEERKVVSVLFCDLVGFTAASELADPEDVLARLAPYHRMLRERIEAYGGTVEKFSGDAVMAVFGAPVAHEDDAERAVRAGLAILPAIEELNASGFALAVRVGVNTGEVVVSLEARPEAGEGFVAGDVVNTAARIQSAAPVGAVAIGESTYAAISRVFDCEPFEPVPLKGKASAVSIWRVRRPLARFGSDLLRTMDTAMIGREREAQTLRSVFDEVAREREVRLVTVSGEPGVGKSRLVAELFAYAESLPQLVTRPQGALSSLWRRGDVLGAQ